MARLSIAVLVLFAVVAAVSASGPGVAPPPPAPHGISGWLAHKAAEIKAWGSAEKAKLKASWEHTLVPQIKQLKEKLGAQWQQKAPQVASLLKEKAGSLYNKALNAANNLG